MSIVLGNNFTNSLNHKVCASLGVIGIMIYLYNFLNDPKISSSTDLDTPTLTTMIVKHCPTKCNQNNQEVTLEIKLGVVKLRRYAFSCLSIIYCSHKTSSSRDSPNYHD